MIIHNRLILIMDGSPNSPLRQSISTDIGLDEQEYLCSVLQKLQTSDKSKQAQMLFNQYTMAHYGLSDPLASSVDDVLQSMQEYFLYQYHSFSPDLPECDFIFLYAQVSDIHYLGVLLLPYRTAIIHNIADDSLGTRTYLGVNHQILPSPSSCFGVLINLSTQKCILHDISVPCGTDKRALFSDLLYSFEDTQSAHDVLKAISDTAEEVMSNFSPNERQTKVKQALTSSIIDTGTIDLDLVSTSLFSNAPEQSEAFQSRLEEAGIPAITAVPSASVVPALEKMRIITDNGISISLPLSIAQNPDTFEILNQEDGSVMIIFRNIQQIRSR